MNSLTPSHLVAALSYAFTTHADCAKSANKAVRKWDGKTPYAVHPAWCALTLLTETSLPEDLRQRGCLALLYHDILEDTTGSLPEDTSAEVARLVEEMTFPGGSAQEMREVWSRSDECKLLKLYDKVSNLLDGIWMDDEKCRTYEKYTWRLACEVSARYGSLNIVRMAEAICDPWQQRREVDPDTPGLS